MPYEFLVIRTLGYLRRIPYHTHFSWVPAQLLLLLLSFPLTQRHGADGHVLVEMNGGFRALQLKKAKVSDPACRKLDNYLHSAFDCPPACFRELHSISITFALTGCNATAAARSSVDQYCPHTAA